MDRIQGLLIDLDGTVFHGDKLIDGAAEAIQAAVRDGYGVAVLSNRGNISREACRAKLLAAGIDLPVERIVLSSSVAAHFLRARYGGASVWLLGEAGLRDEMEQHGVELAARPEEADWLVISLHEHVSYADLNAAFRAARSGARIMATNADRSFPGADGAAIDVAGMIGAITATTGRHVDLVVGKPSWLMAEAALERLALRPEHCLMIGDSMESDIALGSMFGMRTALVLTGSTEKSDVDAARRKPDFVWESIAELTSLLK